MSNYFDHALVIIRLHCSTTYIDAAYCYRPSSVDCWSVTAVSHAKTAEPIDTPCGLRTRVGPSNHVLDGGQHFPKGRDNFEGDVARVQQQIKWATVWPQ